MALAYSEFDTTPTNLVADLRTKILLSSDWSQPNSGTLPNLLACTTTAGAAMRLELGNTSDNIKTSFRAWRTHNGTTGTDFIDHSIWWRQTGGGASDPLHVVVSASKDLLWVTIEGPRNGETNAEDTRGSMKWFFFMSALQPYFGGDTNPVVVVGGHNSVATTPRNYLSNYMTVFVSQAYGTLTAWAPASLCSVTPLVGNGGLISNWTPQPIAAADSNNNYVYPFVVVENAAGLRGTLTDIYHAGSNVQIDTGRANDFPAAVGQSITYSGKTYKIHSPLKGNNINSTSQAYTPLGAWQIWSSTIWMQGPAVAVRSA